MNLAETLRGLGRRWYIVVPGLILAVALGLTTWSITKPAYERTASQILLPGSGTLPEDATNPFLYLGGLPAAADVLVRAVGSEEALRGLLEAHPGAEVEITRDPSTSGPVINIQVTAASDTDAATILNTLVERTAEELDDLQGQQNVPLEDRITVSSISVDQESILQQRDRIVLSAGVAAGIALLVLVIASAVDGLLSRSRRDGRSGGGGPADGDEDALVHEPETLAEGDDDSAPGEQDGEAESETAGEAEAEPTGTRVDASEPLPGPEAETVTEVPDEHDSDSEEIAEPERDRVSDLAEPEVDAEPAAEPERPKGRRRPARPRNAVAAPVGARRA